MDTKDFEKAAPAPIDTKTLLDSLYSAVLAVSDQVSRQKFALRDEDIAGIRGAREAALKIVNENFDNMEDTALKRRENLLAYSPIQFVSVGFDCFARTVLTRWGLKKTAKLGELTYPFDLAIHPTKAVRQILQADFENYLAGVRFNPAAGFCCEEALGIEFIHDKGEKFAVGNYALLKKRYAARIENFREVSCSVDPVVFLFHTEGVASDVEDDVLAIFEMLRINRRDWPVGFVWIHTPPFGPPSSTRLLSTDTLFIEEPYPRARYVWSWPRSALSPRGVKFEQKIIDAIKTFIDTLGWYPTEFIQSGSAAPV